MNRRIAAISTAALAASLLAGGCGSEADTGISVSKSSTTVATTAPVSTTAMTPSTATPTSVPTPTPSVVDTTTPTTPAQLDPAAASGPGTADIDTSLSDLDDSIAALDRALADLDAAGGE